MKRSPLEITHPRDRSYRYVGLGPNSYLTHTDLQDLIQRHVWDPCCWASLMSSASSTAVRARCDSS